MSEDDPYAFSTFTHSLVDILSKDPDLEEVSALVLGVTKLDSGIS